MRRSKIDSKKCSLAKFNVVILVAKKNHFFFLSFFFTINDYQNSNKNSVKNKLHMSILDAFFLLFFKKNILKKNIKYFFLLITVTNNKQEGEKSFFFTNCCIHSGLTMKNEKINKRDQLLQRRKKRHKSVFPLPSPAQNSSSVSIYSILPYKSEYVNPFRHRLLGSSVLYAVDTL